MGNMRAIRDGQNVLYMLTMQNMMKNIRWCKTFFGFTDIFLLREAMHPWYKSKYKNIIKISFN